jgi:hypothetical protein
VFQIGDLKAQAATGGAGAPTTVKQKGKNVDLCQTSLRGSSCITVGKFVVDKTGRVVTFSYLAGGPPQPLVPPVLAPAADSGNGFGVTFQVASYFQARDGLLVILNVTGAPDAARTVEAFQATYQPPNGSPVQASIARGLNSQVQPMVQGTLELEFAGAPQPGGTISIPMLGGPPDYGMGTATVPLH